MTMIVLDIAVAAVHCYDVIRLKRVRGPKVYRMFPCDFRPLR
jgi:hypothetical protein